jgi:hypothetical protein
VLRTREDFDRYQAAFHSGDYEAAFDYYVEAPRIKIFGVEISSRAQLARFYRFMREHVRETVRIDRFAVSDDLVAAETTVHVAGVRELDTQSLREHGMYQFHPIGVGEFQVLRHFIHYRLRDGKIESGSCVSAPD